MAPPEIGTPRVMRLAPSDAVAARRWDDFVTTCPSATFFHRAGWQRVIADVFGQIGRAHV